MLRVAVLFATVATAASFGYIAESGTISGGAWHVWNESTGVAEVAPSMCTDDVAVGDMVDDSCCDIDAWLGLVMGDFFVPYTCMALQLGSGVVRAYANCEDGTFTYGETCAEEGEDYPFPSTANTTELTMITETSAECGCADVIQGSGCFRANDVGDGRQFFVELGMCT
eukprot:CAMPEP_0197410090 /NCGR_PEP_ID=MMETSP1165-20131217/30835_1 /TAXON_ID=284809 /ORGANISM="Chrysocystis fragilis, Strain CCMP3189" /LENGTH=168 /DNA_ID=CAMNT_0042936583 /DNA_START=44 /DNA_END=550 /DNA_ORIENTATION=-